MNPQPNQPRFREIFGEPFTPATETQRVTHAQDVPRSRKTDPRSSQRAESDMKRTGTIRGQALIVLELVRLWPGLSSKDLATKGSLDRYQIARRLSELRTAGYIRSIEHGKDDVVWEPVVIESEP